MDRRPSFEPCATFPPKGEPLAARLRAQEAEIETLKQALRAARLRIATLEARLEQQRQQQRSPAPCPRCAQVAHALGRIQERERDKDATIAGWEQKGEQKDARIATLEKRVAELERKRHRSAAPFRRRPGQKQQDPQPPGREKGHAPSYRPPSEEEIQETVTVPLPCCPHCQGPVADLHPIAQVIVDLPPIQPIVWRLVTYRGTCPRCGKVHSTHPHQVSTATGAAGCHLGAGALAVAATLRHGHGLPLRRVRALLQDLFHLSVSHAGIYEALARMAQRLAPAYEELKETLRQSASVHGDETGWWLAYRGGWLWVFATTETTVYLITRKRSVEAVREVLGERFDGTLVSDCLRVYDRYEAATKSKCVSHHLRKIDEAQQKRPESAFLAAMKRLLQASLKLQRAHAWLPEPVYERGVASLEARLTRLLAPTYPHEEEEKVAQRFRNQRAHIFTFLRHPAVAATNNLAERQLRPAVIARKLSCGNATEGGARTLEVLTSLAATCRQRGASFIAFIANHAKLESRPSGLSPPSSAVTG
jgi:hypothetical protein